MTVSNHFEALCIWPVWM